MGRKRVKGKRWGSRIIDLDILFFDNEIVDKRNLKIPHPRLPQRRFVLVPLSELAPQLIHPGLNVSVSELLATTKDTKKIHMMRASGLSTERIAQVRDASPTSVDPPPRGSNPAPTPTGAARGRPGSCFVQCGMTGKLPRWWPVLVGLSGLLALLVSIPGR